MTTDVIDVEPIRAVTVMETVALPVSVDEAMAQWREYIKLTEALLDDSDYQRIGDRKFKKKSAWRKYARAFNITDRVTYEEIVRYDDGFPRWARIRVEGRAPNGRTAEADHECHATERCCTNPCPKSRWNNHRCCEPDCDGRKHWSHPGDLPATALTRAKNRAISDLIGAGEVSAEEMAGKAEEAAVSEDDRAGSGAERHSATVSLPPANEKGERRMGPMPTVRPQTTGMSSRQQQAAIHTVMSKLGDRAAELVTRHAPSEAFDADGTFHSSRLTVSQASTLFNALSKEQRGVPMT